MDYANTVCESIKIIGESLLQGLKFDKTIECTIIDDSKRNEGSYTVSDGSVSFIAYSENVSYRNNTVVYVTIPNGDYDNDKIITGKKIQKNDSNQPFVYISPFSTIIDVSGNLISNSDKEYGLTANNPEAESLIIYEKAYEEPLYNYTRLGIQAQFKSWLQEDECVNGNYGLKLTIQFKSNAQTDDNLITKIMYLDVADMIGNPYAFNYFYNQEKVFDISAFEGISYIKLEFFQKNGSFYNREGQLIPHINDFDNKTLPFNLFVKDCRVCLGYEVDDYTVDLVKISSSNPKNYSSKITNNKKSIILKWIHIDENGDQFLTDKNSPYEYEIRWYRYLNGEPAADKYCGNGWTDPSNSRNKDVFFTDQGSGKYSATLYPDTALNNVERIKVIILFGPAPKYTLIDKLNKITYDKNPALYYYNENNVYKNCQSLEYNDTYEYYIQDEDKRKTYLSNIIEFTNSDNVINSATIDAIQALSLHCYDELADKESDNKLLYGTYGNYLLYGQDNKLIDSNQSQIKRIIGCKLDLSTTPKDDTETLKNNSIVKWRFPLKDTMIKPIMDYTNETILDQNGDQINTGYGIITMDSDLIEKYIDEYGMPIFQYNIDSVYNPLKSNNYIECFVLKDGINYNAVKELTFGQAGTSDTNWTFTLDINNDANAIISGEEIDIIAQLYDNTGKLQDISNKTINWSFVDPEDTSKEKVQLENVQFGNTNNIINYQRKLIASNNLTMNDLIIVKATINNWENYNLTAFLPIPIRSSEKYTHLIGANQIIYLPDGDPLYYNKFYELSNGDVINDITPIYSKSNDEKITAYMPDIYKEENEVTKYKLKPINLYISNLPIFGIQIKVDDNIVWTQPILIVQNNSPTSVINKQNNKELVLNNGNLNNENGSITNRILGAGKKDEENRFSGILLGEWTGSIASESATNHTGLFGFDKGDLCYSLTDEGIATFGKPTAGQIIIDGNNSLIKSAGYSNNVSSGMEIDLSNNTIIANYKGNQIFKLNANDSNNDDYLTITSPKIIDSETGNITMEPVTLLNVGKTGYFLRSHNYIEPSIIENEDKTNTKLGQGTYIDLNNGNINITTGTFTDDIRLYRTRTEYSPNPNYGKEGEERYLTQTYITEESLNAVLDRFEQSIAAAQQAANTAISAAYAASAAQSSVNTIKSEVFVGASGGVYIGSGGGKAYASASGAGIQYGSNYVAASSGGCGCNTNFNVQGTLTAEGMNIVEAIKALQKAITGS